MAQNSSFGLPWLFPSNFTQFRWSKKQILDLCILLAQLLFSLCWAQLKEILEASRRILKGFPGVLCKVSDMLLRASFLIIQSVSQAETQAKWFLTYLEICLLIRIWVLWGWYLWDSEVLADTLDHSHLLINICQIKRSKWNVWHLYWHTSKNKGRPSPFQENYSISLSFKHHSLPSLVLWVLFYNICGCL